ncbi:MAG TPA: FUSC family protein [Candidatus Solibacter sp.]|nr:FUSC family protein [Candidatus Solibacter sp.]
MPTEHSGFWAGIFRFDSSHLTHVMALRNAIGMAIPLAAGIAAHNPVAGVMAATGALNVALSDGEDPYAHRARRMLTAAVLVSLAVFTGRACGQTHAIAILLEAACAIVAGLLVAVGQTYADIGTITLVTLIVFSATPATLGKALSSGSLALGGALLQCALSLAMWTVRRYGPESAALASLYRELARGASESSPATEAPPATAAITVARDALASLTGDRSVEAERYLALFGQAERIRLSLLVLWRLRTRIAREAGRDAEAARIGECLDTAALVLLGIAEALENRKTPGAPPAFAAVCGDARWQMEALAGQLRSAAELASHTTAAGSAEFERQQSAQPWTLRLAGTFAVLRANINTHSAAMRHAVRLAACVAVADIIGRSWGFQRAYWAPMTVALVLKPDFTATYSRGVLRLAGTFLGLGFATIISHALSPSPPVEAALTVAFFFLMRWTGGANYGILVTALTGLVVFLFALTGISPSDVMAARAINTVVGGVIALLAYWLWPTWERSRISEALAQLLDSYRTYFQAVRDAYLEPGVPHDLSRLRQEGRVARTNLEASMARFASEPGVDAARLTALNTIIANSHRYIHAAMALEAGLLRSRPVPARPAFREFANAVDATLYFLSAYLRGSHAEPGDLPDLRALHRALAESGDGSVDRYALVNIEADRIANTVNSLAEEILHWVGSEA